MKNVKIFCCECGKEIFQEMPEYRQKEVSIFGANSVCCADCTLIKAIRNLKNEKGK